MKQVWLIAAVSVAGWSQTQPATQTATAAPQAGTPEAPQTKVAVPPNPAPISPSPSAPSPASSMAASIAAQRASVQKQVSAITGKAAAPASSFFTVPWIATSADFPVQFAEQFNVPPCDPLPSEQLDPLIEDAAKRQGLKADLIRSVIRQESASRPCAVSVKGAQGLMQLMPATVEQFAVRDPFDPRQNVEAGARLLKQLLDKYNGDVTLALSAYNAGSGRVDREGGVPQIPETINYVNGVLDGLPKH
jgi:soluble lytic murein transglycosylase-like protein